MSTTLDKKTTDTKPATTPTETSAAAALQQPPALPKWMDQNEQLDANGGLKPECRPQPKWKPGAE